MTACLSTRIHEFKAKGYLVYIISSNDPFVMSGWGRIQGVSDNSIVFATDVDNAFSAALDATIDMSKLHFGIRTGRYALVADDLKIKYFKVEDDAGEVSVSGAGSVLTAL